MEGKVFQALVAQLGDLTGVQREALITALKRKLPVNEAVTLIETRFDTDPVCAHCGSRHVGGWSSANGLKRYRCKDCLRTFNALSGTSLAHCTAAMPGLPMLRRSPTARASGRPPSAAPSRSTPRSAGATGS